MNSFKKENYSVSFYTLGCRLNQSETAVIEGTFQRDGYTIVDFNEPADVVVINTCTVTENGDNDTRRLVNKVNRINPKARIALIGCQAQMQKEKLAEWPNVRWVVGNGRKMDLAAIIKGLELSPDPQVIVPAISRKSFKVPIMGVDRHRTRANIKIQDGCDFFCSFCEIPYARGRARSREFEDILKEARVLARNEYKEIVLTGINLGTYNHEGKSFLDVVNALEQIQGIERIRISSIEPTTIPITLLEKMRKQSKLCRHLHIPLQSGSDEVLTAMKRKYSFLEFRRFIEMAFSMVPFICLGTDIIVGFPGEGEEHFSKTAAAIEELPIHYVHVFSYSSRTMAKSRLHDEKIARIVISERSRILRNISQQKRRAFYQSSAHTIQNVLFEEKKEIWQGLTDNYIRVCTETPLDLNNQLRRVYLESIDNDCMTGSLVE